MSRSNLLNPPRRLPDITLQDVRERTPVRLRPAGDRSALIVMIHPECPDCTGWVEKLAEQKDELRTWKGDVKLVGRNRAAEHTFPFRLLLDSENRLAAAVGLEAPAVVIADQWGEIHEAAEAGEEHRFLPIESAVEWIRHLATSCPECEGEAF
ncbi:MAG: redoxin domain-containing protein [Acidobacteria bacterium]|nr:redoxin domain-containing protein [Acidobacteriota bacterium]